MRERHAQPAGTVTDETDLAVALARSLVETGGFDAVLSTAADHDAPRAVWTALANATDGRAAQLEMSGYVVETLETALYDAVVVPEVWTTSDR